MEMKRNLKSSHPILTEFAKAVRKKEAFFAW